MYKIGEAARLLGLSTEALRYYERKGLVVPYKDESSNYRYFDAVQMNQLLHIQKYKKLGFSLCELASLSSNNESQALYDILLNKEQEMIQENLAMSLRLHSMHMAMENSKMAMKAQNCIQWGIRPAMYRLSYMQNGQLVEEQELIDELKKWAKLSELQFLSTRILLTDLDKKTYNSDHGLSMYQDIAEFIGIQTNDSIKFYDECPALIHSFEENGENSILLEIALIKEYMKEHNICIAGDILSEILHSYIGNESYKIRHLLWIPYEIAK